jgi:uncharacterized protein (TIGR03000 family)
MMGQAPPGKGGQVPPPPGKGGQVPPPPGKGMMQAPGKGGQAPGKGGQAPAKGKGTGEEEDATSNQINRPATLVVNLPAQAKLTVDDYATRSVTSVRTFTTPNLEAGTTYYYTLKAEVVRDGQTLTTNKRVAVRAGEETQVSLEFPAASVAQR